MLAVLAGVLSIVLAAPALALAVGASLDPTSSSFAMIGAMLWTTYGPHLLLLALIALGLALATLAFGARKTGRVALAVSVLSVFAAGFIVSQIMWSGSSSGGSANLLAAFSLGDMTVPVPDIVETVHSVEGQDLQAAIYRPGNDARDAPLMVYVHGGGFMAGTNTETAADLRWFADQNWLVISIDYRVFGPGKPTWDKATPDVACGLVWAHANAERFGGDSSRLALLGDSAGGNLAINVGYGAAEGRVESGCGGQVPVPDAIAVQYPAVDPVATYERGFPIPGFEPAMLMAGYVGGTPQEYPDRIAAISSKSFITPKAPPTLIVEPDKDSLVVSDGVYRFAGEALAAGVDLELVRVPFANHIFNQMAFNSLGNQISRTVRLRFLEERVR